MDIQWLYQVPSHQVFLKPAQLDRDMGLLSALNLLEHLQPSTTISPDLRGTYISVVTNASFSSP